MKRTINWVAAALVALGLAFTSHVVSAEDAKVETVVSGLSNPCGLAIQPGSGTIFIADSAAGRVVRVVDGKLEDVVTGYTKDIYGKGPKYDIGPLGLVFLDENTLAVGDGGFVDGEEYVRIFTVPAPGEKALDFDKDVKAKLGPLAGTDEVKPEGNLYGLAATANAIYVTCNGDDTKGWVSKIEIDGTKFGPLTRSIATKEQVEVDAPVGVTISPRGEVVIGQMGEINKPHDGLVTFYSAKTGKSILNLEAGIYDITGLAYSPKGLLYATDFAWMAPTEAGLFRLDQAEVDGKQTIKPVKITSLDKPTAMAFGKDGTLYITVIGPTEEGSQAGTKGSLVKIAPGL